MKRIRHSPEQIIRKLREADAELAKGTAIPEVCKALGIADETAPDYPSHHNFAAYAVRPSRTSVFAPVQTLHPILFTSSTPVTTTRTPLPVPRRDETAPRRIQL